MSNIERNSSFRSDDPYDGELLVISNALLASVTCLITITGVLGNSFILLLFSMSRQLQTVTNIFVVSLTISDLIGCSFVSLQAVALSNLKGWPLPHWVCRMTGEVGVTAFAASIMHLAVISTDRLCMITRSRVSHRKIYNRITIPIMIAFAWFIPFLLVVIPVNLGFGETGYNAKNYICLYDGDKMQLRIITLIWGVFFFGSITVILICYAKILLYVREQHRHLLKYFKNHFERPKASGHTGGNMRLTIDKREIEVTKNLFIVVCGYFLCILPISICHLFQRCYLTNLKFTAVVFGCNSCINPFIYCFKQPRFRQISLCVLRRQWSLIPKPSPWLQRFIFLNKNETDRRRGTSSSKPVPLSVISSNMMSTYRM